MGCHALSSVVTFLHLIVGAIACWVSINMVHSLSRSVDGEKLLDILHCASLFGVFSPNIDSVINSNIIADVLPARVHNASLSRE